MTPIPKSEWVWCGYSGHFIGGSNCRFHLHTRVGDFRVSTVGDYWPPGANKQMEIGVDGTYETFVFRVSGHGTHGEGTVDDWCEIDSLRYKDAEEADRGHFLLCDKYAALEPAEATP